MNDSRTILDPSSEAHYVNRPDSQNKTIGHHDVAVEKATIILDAKESSAVITKANTDKSLSPPIRMIALDLDGTLLQSNHKIADEQVEYLRQLHATTGIIICIATGRAPPSVYEHVQKLALPQPVPVVCSNGARGFHLTFEKETTIPIRTEVFYSPVERTVVESTMQLANHMGFCVQYYLEDAVYANPTTAEHETLIQEYEEVTQHEIVRINDGFGKLLSREDGLPSKLLIRFGNGKLEDAYQAFAKLLGAQEAVGSSLRKATIIKGFLPGGEWFLEILDPHTNKGQGLKRMCEALAISLDHTVAMGDGTNDVEFLTMAGLGVAMKNAHESLQNVADFIIQWTNDENGVIKTLEQLRLKGRLQSQ